jgi:LAO/AO transport system kinase
MEMADALVITKADGDNETHAKRARNEYKNAMHLFPPNPNGWIPKAMTCSAYAHNGMVEIWETIESYVNQLTLSGFIEANRRDQEVYWFRETLKEMLISHFTQTEGMGARMAELEKQLQAGLGNAYADARTLITYYLEQLSNGKN